MMDKKPRIGVDVDGVLGDFLTPAYKAAETLFGVTGDPRLQTTWDMEHLVPPDRVDDFWEFIGNMNFHDLMIPFPGAVAGMKALAEVADVYIVTTHLKSGKTWVYDRDIWLKNHFNINRKKIIHTAAKYTFQGIALVDDKPENVHKWQEENKEGLGILWDQPYNRKADARLIAKSWDAVIAAVENIKTYGVWSPGR